MVLWGDGKPWHWQWIMPLNHATESCQWILSPHLWCCFAITWCSSILGRTIKYDSLHKEIFWISAWFMSPESTFLKKMILIIDEMEILHFEAIWHNYKAVWQNSDLFCPYGSDLRCWGWLSCDSQIIAGFIFHLMLNSRSSAENSALSKKV